MLESERETVHKWKNGDKAAYEAIVRHYMSDAFLVAYGFVGNAEDARDLSQDAFIKAYQARDRFDATRPFYPWLYRILKNHCFNFLKRGRRASGSLYFDDNPDRERFKSDTANPLEELEKSERQEMVRAAVSMLSDDHREIVVLKSFKGYSYNEISEVLEIPMGTVMSRLFYARKMLKSLIERIETDGFPSAVSFSAGHNPATGEVA